MGQGTDYARKDAPFHTKVLDDLKDQLLIALIKRLGGTVDIPAEEIDDTGQDLLMMSLQGRVFHFEVRKKS